jgi:hypothetical protein
MPWQRKLPNDETLAKLVADGMTAGHIAATYSCNMPGVRRKLQRLGLMECRTEAARIAEARNREPSPPRVTSFLRGRRGDRITFTRDFYVQGSGFQPRPLSLPRPSMYLKAIAAKYPQISGGQHA